MDRFDRHLLAQMVRKVAQDALQRLGRVDGVNGRQHEMAGERRLHRHADRLPIAELADDDHVRALAQHVAKGDVKVRGVAADFALADPRHPIAMHELDRVLERDDVPGAGGVDVMHHRRHRGGFAGARRPGHQHEAARLIGEMPDVLREAQRGEVELPTRDRTGHKGKLALLAREIEPEAAAVGEAHPTVKVALAGEAVPEPLGHDGQKLLEGFPGRCRAAGWAQRAVNPCGRRLALGEEQVRCVCGLHRRQQLQDFGVGHGSAD